MLNQATRHDLPLALVDELFKRFKMHYGAQKFGSMWVGMNAGEVTREWALRLAKFPARAIGQALDSWIDAGHDWPPSLPEFVAACRAFRRADSDQTVVMLPTAGASFTDAETARERLAALRTSPSVGTFSPAAAGLPALLRLISDAAGNAGADPAKVLQTLERRFK